MYKIYKKKKNEIFSYTRVFVFLKCTWVKLHLSKSTRLVWFFFFWYVLLVKYEYLKKNYINIINNQLFTAVLWPLVTFNSWSMITVVGVFHDWSSLDPKKLYNIPGMAIIRPLKMKKYCHDSTVFWKKKTSNKTHDNNDKTVQKGPKYTSKKPLEYRNY